MNIPLFCVAAWSIIGLVIFLRQDCIEESMESMTYPQFLFIGGLLGPLVFIGVVLRLIYVMLGKIDWK